MNWPGRPASVLNRQNGLGLRDVVPVQEELRRSGMFRLRATLVVAMTARDLQVIVSVC